METIPQTAPEPNFVAFLALDWADQKHEWRLRTAVTNRVEHGQLDNTPEAIHDWICGLIQRLEGRPIAVCLEQSRGPLIYQLSVYPELVLYPVHPSTVGKYRQAWYPSGAKDDPIDTDLLLEILEKHRNRLRPLVADSEPTRRLRLLVEQRRHWVDERTRHSNQLTDTLKQYFPQLLRWFNAPTSPVVTALLSQWPTLAQLQQQDPDSLREFLTDHRLRKDRFDELLEQIWKAVPVCRDSAIVETSVLAVRCQLAVLAAVQQNIAQLERAIDQQAKAHPDYAIFASLPRAGQALRPRLLVAFGSDRSRFANAAEFAAFTGIAPVQQRSGNQCVVHFRRSCPKFLRQSFHEWANQTIRKSSWAKAFYQAQRKAKVEHHAAIRALAFKWIRILFRCWKLRVPYDEQDYLATLVRRGSPYAPPVEFQFKESAGMLKFSVVTP